MLLSAHPDLLSSLLLEGMGFSSSPEVQTIAAVHFRRLCNFVSEPELSFWPKLAPEQQALAKHTVLGLLAATAEHENVCRKIGDVISTLARFFAQDQGDATGPAWPEMLDTLWQAAHAPNTVLREVSILIFRFVCLFVCCFFFFFKKK